MTSMFQPADPDFANRVRDSFDRQQAMHTIGAELVRVEPGEVEIHLGYDQKLTQQHGFIHAGILSTVLDSACGFAGFSLMPAGAGVLTIEFKTNLLAPARGEKFIARGKVKKPGRTICVAEADLIACQDESRKLVASMTATLMTISGRNDVVG